MKAPSPLLGFNNNFKHKGQVYHIQTEDSGIKHPHIITHLFADGGRILKSVKTSYAAVLGDANMADVVRNMMKEQHKAMIIALRDGQFDPGGAKEVKLPTTGAFAHTGNAGAGRPVRTSIAPGVPGGEAAAPAISAAVVPTESAPIEPPPPAPTPIAAPPTTAPDRAAANASGKAAFFQPQSDLPPPPPNVLGGVRPHGEYSHQSQPAAKKQSIRPASAAPAKRGASISPPGGQAGVGGPSRPPSAPGRYAATRPASIFATNKPASGSIFGEDLISERSLDEVILSYLAEDLDGEKK
jgi:hypothetical protein